MILEFDLDNLIIEIEAKDKEIENLTLEKLEPIDRFYDSIKDAIIIKADDYKDLATVVKNNRYYILKPCKCDTSIYNLLFNFAKKLLKPLNVRLNSIIVKGNPLIKFHDYESYGVELNKFTYSPTIRAKWQSPIIVDICS